MAGEFNARRRAKIEYQLQQVKQGFDFLTPEQRSADQLLGCNIDVQLYEAAKRGDLAACETSMEHGGLCMEIPKVLKSETASTGQQPLPHTPLEIAMIHSQYHVADAFMLGREGTENMILLQECANKGSTDEAQALIDAGVYTNSADHGGWTPVM
jgi:hypothetical protein